jgi:adenylate kinase family enzyme
MIEDALPENMRGRNTVFNKSSLQTLLRELADKHPDKYVEVSQKLANIGRQVATETGGFSFGLGALTQTAGAKATLAEIRGKVKKLLANPYLTDKQRNELVIKTVGGYQQKLMDDVYTDSLAEKNPIAMQIMSGSRGNKMNLASLRGADLLYEDHRGDIIPVPVLKSYSQGLTPAEYWAGTYGARKGVIATKFATADAGFFGKQLNQVAHRLAVVDQDDPRQDLGVRGLPVDTDDMDNEGALLAFDFGGYKRNTVLTPKILKDLKARKFDRILVRSPMTGGSPDGGVYARDVGVRERGTLPGRGEMVGMTAAQAIAEPISQGQLGSKHSGGVAGQEKTVGGFQYINQLIQVPKTFKGGAAHTLVDGKVQKIEDAPAGGKYVFINDKPQYVGHGFDINVKPGDEVEAGDVISEGMPNPSIITEHKGIGEGRKYFVKAFKESMGSMGLRSHRRNIELIGRGLIDHVRMTEEYGDHVPDDVIPYSTLEHGYKPREGFQTLEPSRALNKYLEKPVLHYSIGTQVKPSMLKDMQYFGVKDIAVHDKPAPFQPEMVRAMYNLHHDPDWMTRMYGSGLKSSLLDATHRGSTSSATGTSFVPGLAKSVDFGRVGQIRQSEPGLKPDLNTPVATPMTPNTDTEKLSSDDLYFVKCAETDPSKVILISGHSGAGKSTVAKQLSDALGLPVTSIDDHPALKQIFKNDPENKHMTPGSIERRRYLDAARRMALDTINSAKDGAIVEGTQLAALRKQQLAQYPHRVLVTTPLTELLQQRLDRTKQRVEAKGNPWTPEVEAYRSELGRKLYDSNKSDMSRFGNTPGTLTHNTRADNVDSLLDSFKNQYKHADDILAPKDVLSQDEIYNQVVAALGKPYAGKLHHVSGGLPDVKGLSDVDVGYVTPDYAKLIDKLPQGTTVKHKDGKSIYAIPGYARAVGLYATDNADLIERSKAHRDVAYSLAAQHPELVENAIKLKQTGIGTEPAWAKVLGLTGDPYEAMRNRKLIKTSDDILPGGIGDKYNVSDFPKKEMAKGVKTESEHTTNPAIAADISKDHLVEDPKYYTKLEKVEKKSAYSIADGIARARNKRAADIVSLIRESTPVTTIRDIENAAARRYEPPEPAELPISVAQTALPTEEELRAARLKELLETNKILRQQTTQYSPDLGLLDEEVE